MERDRPAAPRDESSPDLDEDEEIPEPLEPDEVPDVEDLDGAEKIGENRYLIRTGDSNESDD